MSEHAVIAIIAAYNEADVIAQVIGDLVSQGVSVYLIDDGSTDDSVARASAWLNRGLIGVESLEPIRPRPNSHQTLYSWRRILARKQELALELPGRWFIHHDADELRDSPWPNLGLAQAIDLVDRLGYNAIDFSVYSFWPTNDGFQPGGDLRAAFEYFEPGWPCDRLQIRCWKRTESRVELVSSGGHEAVFPGRSVFPIRFILRHYPFRGTDHGRRKLYEEREPRYDPDERAMGWHLQYDDLASLSFVRDPASLKRFDADEVRARLAIESRLVEELQRDPEALQLLEEGARRELAACGHELHEKNLELIRMSGELDTRNRECARISAELHARNLEVIRLSGPLDTRNHEVKQLNDALAAAQRDIARLEETSSRLADVLASRSWRWTAPLRRLLTILGRH